MTNRAKELDYANLPDALDFWLGERLKAWVHTAMPGQVISYGGERGQEDPAGGTKRAVVLPAIRLLMTDGSQMRQPPVVDVPVVHGGGGGFTMHYPLAKGDAVLLVFSERGIAEWKRTWAEARPDMDSLFDRRDAYAIPIGTSSDMTIVDEDAVTLQTEDGADYIALKPGAIELKTTGTITLDSGGDTLVVR